MLGAVFIGDEVTGAGYRLAGLRVVAAGPDEAGEALASARREDAALILIGAGSAGGIDGDELERVHRQGAPPVVVVPDAQGGEPPDLAAVINRAFGLEQ
ncbi:V-type ATP synthase subunit F [Lentisalinibacter salinarum]|uniref:V-type ATP synthase subunit F n=1 Tax=Lentisalinibacter salinarum TaxID=2992239 RepID=UPI003867401A